MNNSIPSFKLQLIMHDMITLLIVLVVNLLSENFHIFILAICKINGTLLRFLLKILDSCVIVLILSFEYLYY